MQFTTLFLAALSASKLTIALPTMNSTDPFAYDEDLEGSIEKRATYGWLANYRFTDPLCSFGWGGSRPQVHDSCIVFNSVSNRVGINWGTFPNAFDALDVYSDNHCLKRVGIIKAPDKHKAKGAQTCVLQSNNGGKWNSVRSHAAGPGK